MARLVQVTVDAKDPHGLARWWADLLGYEVEDGHDFVQGLLADGVITDADVVLRWANMLDPEGNEFCLQ